MSLEKKDLVNIRLFGWFSAVLSLLSSIQQAPYMKYVSGVVDQRLLSFSFMVPCISGFIVSYLCQKKKILTVLTSQYVIITGLANTIWIFSDVWFLTHLDVKYFAECLIIVSMITNGIIISDWINNGYTFMKAAIFDTTEKRNAFELKNNMISCVPCILGYGLGSLIEISIKQMFIASIACSIIMFAKNTIIFEYNKEKLYDKISKIE